MKKLIFASVLLTTIFLSYSNAGMYFSGQKEYLKECRDCHGRSGAFVNNYTIEQWNDLLANDGLKLASLHAKITVVFNDDDEEEDKAKKRDTTQRAVEYFKSERYVNKVGHINAFVVTFAKDSEAKPANQ